MWSMDVYSKAWLLLWRGGSNPSLREEGPSLRSGSTRSRQLLHGMGSISHRFATPMDQWKTDFIARRNGREDERRLCSPQRSGCAAIVNQSDPSCVDTTKRRAAARSDAMTQTRVEDSSTERTQRIYARVAGFLFLWLIITGLAGTIIISHIVGSGTFAENAKRAVASEHLYRVALSSELIETLSAALLAFALYVTLKPVDKLLARIAMFWRLGESFIGGVGMIVGFVRLHLYSSQSIGALGAGQSQ